MEQGEAPAFQFWEESPLLFATCPCTSAPYHFDLLKELVHVDIPLGNEEKYRETPSH